MGTEIQSPAAAEFREPFHVPSTPGTQEPVEEEQVHAPDAAVDEEASLRTEVARLQVQLSNLQAALDTRDLIGMAKGIIMAQENCTPKQAFAILSRASQRENRKLAELAKRIVARFASSC